MDEMTIGVLYIAIMIIKEFIEAVAKCTVTAGVIIFLLSLGYGIYDRIRSRHGKTDKEKES